MISLPSEAGRLARGHRESRASALLPLPVLAFADAVRGARRMLGAGDPSLLPSCDRLHCKTRTRRTEGGASACSKCCLARERRENGRRAGRVYRENLRADPARARRQLLSSRRRLDDREHRCWLSSAKEGVEPCTRVLAGRRVAEMIIQSRMCPLARPAASGLLEPDESAL